MAILIDETKKVLIQGITGREGMARAQLMMDYGTKGRRGCSAGRGGQEVLGVRVYDAVEEAVRRAAASTSASSSSPPLV